MANPLLPADNKLDPAAITVVHMTAYYAENLEAWFAHIDSSFATAHMTRSVTKFHYTNTYLPLSL